jgi:hypothetical protein
LGLNNLFYGGGGDLMKTFLGYGKARDFPGESSLLEEGRRVYRLSEDHWCPRCDGEGCRLCNGQGTREFLTKCQIREKITYLVNIGGFEILGGIRFKKTVDGRVTRNRVIRNPQDQLRFLEREVFIIDLRNLVGSPVL